MPDEPESQQPQEPAQEPAQDQGPDSAQLADMAAVQSLARSLGQVINNTYLYGTAHKVTLLAREQSYDILNQILSQWARVNFSMAENDLLADGRIVDLKNPLVAAFTKQLKVLGISGFSLERGMPRDEFDKLVELINTHPDKMKQLGSFSDAVAASGMAHVQARTAIYQLVTEEDLVVRKGDLEQALTEAGTAGAVGGVDEVIEYLTGKAEHRDEAAVRKQLASMAENAAELADVVMKAAEMQKDSLGEAGRSFVDLIVSSLKLAYESLCQDPSVRTQQGKKNLSKTLLLLQQEILKRFTEASGEETPAGAEAIANTLGEMVNELTVDALAADYARKRTAIENTEKKIARFINTVEEEEPEALDVLKQEFMARGLSEEGWEELLAKTRARKRKKARAGGEEPAPPPTPTELNALLAHLVEVVASSNQASSTPDRDAEIVQILTRVDQEVNTVVTQAEDRIEQLAEEIKEATQGPAKGGGARATAKQALSRRRLMALLAEIGQELCQPLSVINCTLDMLKSKILGDITTQQEEMVVLAATSGERLRVIIDKLLMISGIPTSTQPDQAILDKLYK